MKRTCRVEGAFRLLHPTLQELLAKRGYCRPTPVQEKAIPRILSGSNVLVAAPTGSGKTEAAVLPLASRILSGEWRRRTGIVVLYVTPLRSLNRDIFARMESLLAEAGLSVFIRHGDSVESERRAFLRGQGFDLVVVTPETLAYLLASSQKFREMLRDLRAVVVDELHELMGSKRGSELTIVFERLERVAGRRVQRIGLSATISDPLEAAHFLGGVGRHVEIVEAPVSKRYIVTVESPEPSSEDTAIAAKLGVEPDTVARLRRILEYRDAYGHVLVFTNTRDTAELLSKLLRSLAEDVGVHHGSLSREERLRVERLFREGKLGVLVATSSLELGIDIGHVEYVVQYLSPRQAQKLVQRVGRSGHRIGEASRGSIIALRNFYDVLESLVLAARALRGDLEDVRPYEKPLDALAHMVAGIVDERGEVPIHELYDIVSSAWPYRSLGLDELHELLETMEYARIVRVDRARGVVRRGGRLKRYHYSVTMIPDVKQYVVVEYGSGRRIGVLDEVFVARLEPGATFVLAGSVWEVVDIGESRVLVRKLEESSLVLPAWEGDLIPVEWPSAREAGSLVRRLAAGDPRVEKLYPGSDDAWMLLRRVLEEHIGRGYPVPSDRSIVVEVVKDTVALLGFYGTRVAKALEFLLAGLVEETLGYTPHTGSNAYLVMLKFNAQPSREYVENLVRLLGRLEWSEVERIVLDRASRSNLYYWKLYHVAVRMGLVEKGAKIDRRLLETLRDTLAGREALRELVHDKLDLEGLRRLLEGVSRWVEGRPGFTVHIVYGREPSPLLQHAAAIATSGDRVKMETLPSTVLAEVLRKRLEEKRVRLVCLRCGHVFEERLGSLDDRPRCPRCGSGFIAPTSLEPREARRLVDALRRGERLRGEDAKRLRELREAGDLVLTYGKYALYALAVRGVGPSTAKKVLGRLAFGEEAFFKALVEAQERYMKTRRYWR